MKRRYITPAEERLCNAALAEIYASAKYTAALETDEYAGIGKLDVVWSAAWRRFTAAVRSVERERKGKSGR